LLSEWAIFLSGFGLRGVLIALWIGQFQYPAK